jgi:hypothetical protein
MNLNTCFAAMLLCKCSFNENKLILFVSLYQKVKKVKIKINVFFSEILRY